MVEINVTDWHSNHPDGYDVSPGKCCGIIIPTPPVFTHLSVIAEPTEAGYWEITMTKISGPYKLDNGEVEYFRLHTNPRQEPDEFFAIHPARIFCLETYKEYLKSITDRMDESGA